MENGIGDSEKMETSTPVLPLATRGRRRGSAMMLPQLDSMEEHKEVDSATYATDASTPTRAGYRRDRRGSNALMQHLMELEDKINGHNGEENQEEEEKPTTSPPPRPGGFRRRASSVLRQLDAEEEEAKGGQTRLFALNLSKAELDRLESIMSTASLHSSGMDEGEVERRLSALSAITDDYENADEDLKAFAETYVQKIITTSKEIYARELEENAPDPVIPTTPVTNGQPTRRHKRDKMAEEVTEQIQDSILDLPAPLTGNPEPPASVDNPSSIANIGHSNQNSNILNEEVRSLASHEDTNIDPVLGSSSSSFNKDSKSDTTPLLVDELQEVQMASNSSDNRVKEENDLAVGHVEASDEAVDVEVSDKTKPMLLDLDTFDETMVEKEPYVNVSSSEDNGGVNVLVPEGENASLMLDIGSISKSVVDDINSSDISNNRSGEIDDMTVMESEDGSLLLDIGGISNSVVVEKHASADDLNDIGDSSSTPGEISEEIEAAQPFPTTLTESAVSTENIDLLVTDKNNDNADDSEEQHSPDTDHIPPQPISCIDLREEYKTSSAGLISPEQHSPLDDLQDVMQQSSEILSTSDSFANDSCDPVDIAEEPKYLEMEHSELEPSEPPKSPEITEIRTPPRRKNCIDLQERERQHQASYSSELDQGIANPVALDEDDGQQELMAVAGVDDSMPDVIDETALDTETSSISEESLVDKNINTDSADSTDIDEENVKSFAHTPTLDAHNLQEVNLSSAGLEDSDQDQAHQPGHMPDVRPKSSALRNPVATDGISTEYALIPDIILEKEDPDAESDTCHSIPDMSDPEDGQDLEEFVGKTGELADDKETLKSIIQVDHSSQELASGEQEMKDNPFNSDDVWEQTNPSAAQLDHRNESNPPIHKDDNMDFDDPVTPDIAQKIAGAPPHGEEGYAHADVSNKESMQEETPKLETEISQAPLLSERGIQMEFDAANEPLSVQSDLPADEPETVEDFLQEENISTSESQPTYQPAAVPFSIEEVMQQQKNSDAKESDPLDLETELRLAAEQEADKDGIEQALAETTAQKNVEGGQLEHSTELVKDGSEGVHYPNGAQSTPEQNTQTLSDDREVADINKTGHKTLELVEETANSSLDSDSIDIVTDQLDKLNTPTAGTPELDLDKSTLEAMKDHTKDERQAETEVLGEEQTATSSRETIPQELDFQQEVAGPNMALIDQYTNSYAHGGFVEGETRQAVIVLSACHFPPKTLTNYSDIMDHLFLYVFQSVQKLDADEYTILYLQGAAKKSQLPGLSWMKQCHDKLGRSMRKSLKRLFVVHPTFWTRAAIFWARPFISSKFYNKIHYAFTLEELNGKLSIQQVPIPQQVRLYDVTKGMDKY